MSIFMISVSMLCIPASAMTPAIDDQNWNFKVLFRKFVIEPVEVAQKMIEHFHDAVC